MQVTGVLRVSGGACPAKSQKFRGDVRIPLSRAMRQYVMQALSMQPNNGILTTLSMYETIAVFGR